MPHIFCDFPVLGAVGGTDMIAGAAACAVCAPFGMAFYHGNVADRTSLGTFSASDASIRIMPFLSVDTPFLK